MIRIQRKIAAGILALGAAVAGFAWGIRPAPAEGDPPASKLDLTSESFAPLLAAIRPQGNEWRHLRVRWHTDIVAARKKAAQEDKPILVFRTGGAGYNDPLGQC